MGVRHQGGVRLAVAMLAIALVLVVSAAAGCTKSGPASPSATNGETTPGTGASRLADKAKIVDYEALLTQDDARAISGYADAVITHPDAMLGTSAYLAVFDSPQAREFLWLRVGDSAMFDEQRKVTAGAETDTRVGGLEAYTWSGQNIDSGVALRKGDKTYLITSKWSAKNGVLAPLLTQDQLMRAAQLVAGRL